MSKIPNCTELVKGGEVFFGSTCRSPTVVEMRDPPMQWGPAVLINTRPCAGELAVLVHWGWQINGVAPSALQLPTSGELRLFNKSQTTCGWTRLIHRTVAFQNPPVGIAHG